MATEFNDAIHKGIFLQGDTLTNGNGYTVRQSELTLAALRAAGVLDTMIDGLVAPTTDKLWLDKNFDPAVLKIYDSTGFTWVPVTFSALFNRGVNSLKVTPFVQTVNSPNAYSVVQPSVFADGFIYSLVPTANNTGNTTVTVQGVGTYPVMYPDNTQIPANEMVGGRLTILLYSDSKFYVLFPMADAYNAQIAAAAAAAAALSAVPNTFPSTRALLKSTDTATHVSAYLREPGREGQFVWTAGDFSARIAADPLEGIYIKADAVAATDGAWVRVYSGEVDVRWWGCILDWSGATGTDNLPALQAAFDTGKNVVIPPGKCGYKGTLLLTTPFQTVTAYGSELYWMGNTNGNGEAYPMIMAMPAAIGGGWKGGKVDHRGSLWTSASSGPAFLNVALCTAFVIMADRFLAEPQEVHNGFDNGIGVISVNLNTGVQVNGSPHYVKVRGVHSFNCGVGIQTHNVSIGPHQAGSGVNVLTGGQCVVEQCTDFNSRSNFIADYSGGASGAFIGCIGYGAKLSVSGTTTFDGVAGVKPGGFGCYSGAREFQWIGCEFYDSEGVGIWCDGYAFNTTFVNPLVKGSARQGIYLNGDGNTLINPQVLSASRGNTGVYSAIKVVGSARSAGTFINSTRLQITNPVVEGSDHKNGIEVAAGSGGQTVTGTCLGGMLSGTSAPVNNGQLATFSVSAYKEIGAVRDWLISDAKHDFRRENVSYLTNAFGDTNQNGNLVLSSASSPAKRLAMGYDPVNDLAVIQAIHSSTIAKPLLLNPSGGGLGVGIGGIVNYADDTAAAAGGVAIGRFYRTGSALKIRVA